jgi:hypothetical protein
MQWRYGYQDTKHASVSLACFVFCLPPTNPPRSALLIADVARGAPRERALAG